MLLKIKTTRRRNTCAPQWAVNLHQNCTMNLYVHKRLEY